MESSRETPRKEHAESCVLRESRCGSDAVQRSNGFNWLMFNLDSMAAFNQLNMSASGKKKNFMQTLHSSKVHQSYLFTITVKIPQSYSAERPADCVCQEWWTLSAGLAELQTFSQSYGWSPACEQEYGKCPSLCGTLFVTQTGPAVTAGDHTAGRHAHSVRRERGAADTFSDCSRCSWLEQLRHYAH